MTGRSLENIRCSQWDRRCRPVRAAFTDKIPCDEPQLLVIHVEHQGGFEADKDAVSAVRRPSPPPGSQLGRHRKGPARAMLTNSQLPKRTYQQPITALCAA